MATKSADAFDALYGLVGFKIEDSVNAGSLCAKEPQTSSVETWMKQNLLDKKPFLIKLLLQSRRLFVPFIFVSINKFDE